MNDFLPAPFTGIYLPNAVDGERCVELLAALDRRGFAPTGERYPRGYRDNDRLVFDDPELAAELYARLGDRVPRERVVGGVRWLLCGFNPRFRACRYRDGQAFCIHRDGPHVPTDDVRSYLTVQLYLDDAPPAGGRTRFYADAAGTECWAAIAPQRGAAIVFDHHAWHDGEAVSAGVKHVLRTDAMYRRATAEREEPGVHGEPGEPGVPDEPDVLDVRGGVIGRHRGYAWRVVACRDGTLASSGRDGTVRRWTSPPRIHDLGAGSVIALVEDTRGRLWCGTRSGAIAIVDDGITRIATDAGAALGGCAIADRVVFATSRGTLVAFDAGGALAWTSCAHDGWAWAAAAFGDAIVSCGEDGRVALTDRDGRTRTLRELGVPLRAIAFADGGLLVGDTRGWVHRLDRAGETVATTRAHAGAITTIAVAPDGTWATGAEDGRVRRWRDGRALGEAAALDFVTCVAIDARGDVACAGYDGAVWLATCAPTADTHAATQRTRA